MVERALILLVLVVAALAAWRLIQWRAARRRDVTGLSRLGYRRGRPAVLYFTAPGCVPCEAIQKPALDRLDESFRGNLQILEVDATADPGLADRWGVLAVPTTFLIDAAGQPRRVNHGPTHAAALLAQLREIGAGDPRIESTAQEGDSRRTLGSDEGSGYGTIRRAG